MNAKSGKRFVIFAVIFALLACDLPVLYTAFYHELTGAPKAENGQMEISTENPGEGKIYLDGEWKFYWNRLLISDPEQTPEADLLLSVPDGWSNYEVGGERLPAAGFGSYELKLTGFAYDAPIALYIPDFSGAYRVYLDGELAAESGKTAKSAKDIFTSPKAKLYPKVLSPGTHQVVIEVATTHFSGLYMTPVLGDFDLIMKHNDIRDMTRLILFGVALFSLLSLIAMYFLNVKRKLHSAWMPLMVFFIVLRIMLTSEFYSTWQPILFFGLSYESTNEVMYFSSFALKYLLLFLADEQCGISVSRKEKLGFLIYYVVLYLVYLLTPQVLYNQYFSVAVPALTYVLDVYLFVKLYRNWKNLKRFGMPVFWGAILILVGLALDSYFINGKIYIDMSWTLLLAFTLFSLLLCCTYGMRIADLYDDFARSSVQLRIANSQIAMQKEYYEALSERMNEIREMKHDVRHFVGTMSRLAEEEKFEELKSFLKEYDERTEMEQLPVFCENVIVNSLLGYYYLRTKENGIKFESRCQIDQKSVMSDSDYCIVLGNALENAIHACKQIAEKEKRYLSVEVAVTKKQRLFKLKNSYAGTLKISNGRFLSTKEGDFHGLGIRSIENAVESYGGFVIIEHDKNEFTLMASILEVSI